jgi:hypothetical protein
MSKVRTYQNGDKITRMIFCPACQQAHAVNDSWTFNGDMDKPTFSPSLLVHGHKDISDDEHAKIMRGEHVELIPLICHSFVKDGKIQFLGDCTHEMAGKTVDLEEF